MERFFGSRTTFSFAFALPATAPTNGTAGSFIGQLTFPLAQGLGWGALGLTGEMEGNFILAVWPDTKGGVMASFRQATDEDNPPEVTGAFSVKPIPGADGSGVRVNQTSLTYTFLCEKCLDSTLGLGPETIASGQAVMGWALSAKPPQGDATNPGARLGFHERGFGPFTARLRESMTAKFDAVAASVAGAAAVPASKTAVAAVPGAFKDGGDDDDDDDKDDDKNDKKGGGKGGDSDDSGDESDDEDD